MGCSGGTSGSKLTESIHGFLVELTTLAGFLRTSRLCLHPDKTCRCRSTRGVPTTLKLYGLRRSRIPQLSHDLIFPTKARVELARSSHVLREPVEHGLRAALELQVAIEPGGRALDPLQLLPHGGNIVKNCLDVTRMSKAIVVNLI